jgi:hypothetical protein
VPRKTYKLTDQTFQALIGHEAAIADEMGCDPSYIYGIKNQSNTDPYPKFRQLYRSTLRAGGGSEYWDNDLAAIRAASKGTTIIAEPIALLLKKVRTDTRLTEEILKAVEDGILDEKEINTILRGVRAVRKNCDEIDAALYQRLGLMQTDAEVKNETRT